MTEDYWAIATAVLWLLLLSAAAALIVGVVLWLT
jgi:hypothetical protein